MPRRTLMGRVHSWTWSTPIRKGSTVSVVLAFVILASTAITKIAEAWAVAGNKLPVSYSTVQAILDERDKKHEVKLVQHEKDDKEFQAGIIKRNLDTQRDLADGKRQAAQGDVYRWSDKMEETPDHEKRNLYRDRMREAQETLDKLKDQVRTLDKLRSN